MPERNYPIAVHWKDTYPGPAYFAQDDGELLDALRLIVINHSDYWNPLRQQELLSVFDAEELASQLANLITLRPLMIASPPTDPSGNSIINFMDYMMIGTDERGDKCVALGPYADENEADAVISLSSYSPSQDIQVVKQALLTYARLYRLPGYDDVVR